jgi:hypothetical protein
VVGSHIYNDQVKEGEIAWLVARIWERRNAYGILVGKPEGKRPLGTPRRKWEDNIKTDLRDRMEWKDWIDLAQDRDQWAALANAIMNFRLQ